MQPTGHPSSQPAFQPTSQPTLQPTSQPTTQPTQQPTNRPTKQPTARPSSQPYTQPTGQPSQQPSRKPTRQPTLAPTSQPTTLPSLQPTTQPTAQPSCQPSRQPLMQPTSQPTLQPSTHPTYQPSSQPTGVPSQQPSLQPSMQPSSKPSGQPSGQPTSQPTIQPSNQPSNAPSSQPTMQPTAQPTCSPTEQPTLQPSITPTGQPSLQPTSQPSRTPSRQPSTQPSIKPSSQPTERPTHQPSSQPSHQPTILPTKQPVSVPSRQPSRQPSAQPSRQPSRQPSSQPSRQPSKQPISQPSSKPSDIPTIQPSCTPTTQPSSQPTTEPSGQPTAYPTFQPTVQPSMLPSMQFTWSPSTQPSKQPARAPSQQPHSYPSRQPSIQPTQFPSIQPTSFPTAQPSHTPSNHPSIQPTRHPTTQPSHQPTRRPSSRPSRRPSSQPSAQPSRSPSMQPQNQPSTQPISQPSHIPFAQPSSRPSRIPTLQPSSSPSRIPSRQPTSHPTRPPSHQPTAMPTRQPINRPSSKPSRQPSEQPTRQPSNYPSSQPTRQPVVFPTHKPSMPIATLAPTSALVDSFSANQVIQGVSASSWASTPATAIAFTNAVASAMAGISPSQITIDSVVDSSSRRLHRILLAAMSSVQVSYTVGFNSQTLGFSDLAAASLALTSQLSSSINSGNFTVSLRTYAAKLDCAILSNVTSAKVVLSAPVRKAPTANPTLTPTGAPILIRKQTISSSVLIAASTAFGLLVLLAIVFCIFWRYRSIVSRKQKEAQQSVPTSTADPVGPSPPSSSDAYWSNNFTPSRDDVYLSDIDLRMENTGNNGSNYGWSNSETKGRYPDDDLRRYGDSDQPGIPANRRGIDVSLLSGLWESLGAGSLRSPSVYGGRRPDDMEASPSHWPSTYKGQQGDTRDLSGRLSAMPSSSFDSLSEQQLHYSSQFHDTWTVNSSGVFKEQNPMRNSSRGRDAAAKSSTGQRSRRSQESPESPVYSSSRALDGEVVWPDSSQSFSPQFSGFSGERGGAGPTFGEAGEFSSTYDTSQMVRGFNPANASANSTRSPLKSSAHSVIYSPSSPTSPSRKQNVEFGFVNPYHQDSTSSRQLPQSTQRLSVDAAYTRYSGPFASNLQDGQPTGLYGLNIPPDLSQPPDIESPQYRAHGYRTFHLAPIEDQEGNAHSRLGVATDRGFFGEPMSPAFELEPDI